MGHSAATGTGGGTGESHACAVSGSFFVLIHAGQPGPSEASPWSGIGASFVGLLELDDEKSKASLDNPAFFNANFVVRLENMADAECVQREFLCVC